MGGVSACIENELRYRSDCFLFRGETRICRAGFVLSLRERCFWQRGKFCCGSFFGTCGVEYRLDGTAPRWLVRDVPNHSYWQPAAVPQFPAASLSYIWVFWRRNLEGSGVAPLQLLVSPQFPTLMAGSFPFLSVGSPVLAFKDRKHTVVFLSPAAAQNLCRIN